MKNFNDTIQWYDEHAKDYSTASFQTASVELIDTFLNYLPSHPTILDAGCGSGRDCDLMAKKGASMIGLDLSKGLLREAKRKYPHIDFVGANFLDIPFEKETFDGVWAHAALVHLETVEDVKKSLEEFYRVLKKKGILHIYVREIPPIDEKDLIYDKERFFRYFTKEEMEGYIKDSGFTIKDSFLRQRKGGRQGLRWVCIFAQK